MNVKIAIVRDTATPALKQVAQMVEYGTALLGAAGHRVVRDTSAHVRKWGLEHPNKLGGRRTNFWSGIADKINPADALEVSGRTATISLGGPDMPGLTRAFGDVTIVPGTKTPGAKYLAIPARAEAYGVRPREMDNLVVFWGKNGPAGLKQVDAQAVTVVKAHQRKGAAISSYVKPGAVSGGLVMYWFATSVTQPQDRTLLPSVDEWSESATAGAEDYAVQQLRKIKGGAA